MSEVIDLGPATAKGAPLDQERFSVTRIDLTHYDDEGKSVIQQLEDVVKPSEGCITEDENRERSAAAMSMDIPSIGVLRGKYAGRKVIICGGGSSLVQTLPDIRQQLAESDPIILAVNKTGDWLISEGIVPNFLVVMDPRSHIPDYVTPHEGVKYLFAGCVDRALFEKCKNHEVYLWHATGTKRDELFMREVIGRNPTKSIAMIPGPSTVGLRSVYISMDIMGFAEIELHGFDSCYDPITSKLWPYEKAVSFEDKRIGYTARHKGDGSKFMCVSNADMARQVYEFEKMIKLFRGSLLAGVRKSLPHLTVAGDGVIPWMAWKNSGHATPDRMAKKYGNSRIFNYQTGAEAEDDGLPGAGIEGRVPSAYTSYAESMAQLMGQRPVTVTQSLFNPVAISEFETVQIQETAKV